MQHNNISMARKARRPPIADYSSALEIARICTMAKHPVSQQWTYPGIHTHTSNDIDKQTTANFLFLTLPGLVTTRNYAILRS